MSRARTVRRFVERVTVGDDGGATTSKRPDELIVEEPLSIQLDGTLVSTTMRTPGHDYELAVGFCFTDGLLGGAPVTGIRYCADGSALDTDFNVVTVETGGRAPTPSPRLGGVSSSCGWCGSDRIDELSGRLEPLDPRDPFPPHVLSAIVDTVIDDQSLFAVTGSVHAAAAFDRTGRPLVVREDVGRHNAVDKVVGHLLLDGSTGVPVDDLGLFVSGRASIEMVQKAWAAGFHTLVAVSAPTALAVDAASRANLTLAGFLRDGTYNVY